MAPPAATLLQQATLHSDNEQQKSSMRASRMVFSREYDGPVQPSPTPTYAPGQPASPPVTQPSKSHPPLTVKDQEAIIQQQLDAFDASLRKIKSMAIPDARPPPHPLLSALTSKAAASRNISEQGQRSIIGQPGTRGSSQSVTGVDARGVKQPPVLAVKQKDSAVVHAKVNGSSLQTAAEVAMKNAREGAISQIRTVLNAAEIADLKQYHDNSLAANSKKAYQSDYDSFLGFMQERFPRLSTDRLQEQCTLEHVLAYLNQLCNEGKKMSTINRHYATIRKHILPALFSKSLVSGSREEEMMREVERIVKGMRRTVGAENRIRGKKPLLIEHIRKMVDVAKKATDDGCAPMPNKRCRDVALLLFMFFSAMRRSEIAALLWSDLTFDKRGVVVLIRKSKTDQESKSQPIALPRLEYEYCPVVALEAWKVKSGGEGDSPVFRWISKKDEIQWRVLIDQRIVALVKAYCEQIGFDPACFAAHSTRSGYVTSSSERGVPISEMMKRTRHHSVTSLQVYMKSDDLFQGVGDRRL